MPVSHHRDVAYASRPSGELLLDLTLPGRAADGGPVPVVIWLHGGGWFTGDRTLAPDLDERARRTGLAYASIEYRLSPEARFPAQIIDVREAVRFLRSHADRWNLDPERIGLWGSSAGAHLAALAGATGHVARWEGEDPVPGAPSAAVQAVAAAYPPVDLARIVDDASEARRQACRRFRSRTARPTSPCGPTKACGCSRRSRPRAPTPSCSCSTATSTASSTPADAWKPA